MEKFIPIVFVLGFPLFWVAISLLASRIGGWARLAEHYPDNVDEQGETYHFRSGNVGIVGYGACLTLSVCQNGLRLSMLFPFRIGHSPLFIPWDQFHSTSEKRILFSRSVDTYVGMPVIGHLSLPVWLRDHLPTGEEIG